MKHTHNISTKTKEKLGLTAIIAGFSLFGILLCMFKTDIFFISSNDMLVFGILMILSGVMYVPGLIWKLLYDK